MITKFLNGVGWVISRFVAGVLIVVVVVVGVFSLWFAAKANEPMNIPQAEQSIPGVTFAQLWNDRQEQGSIIDQKHIQELGEIQGKNLVQKYIAPVLSGNECKVIEPITSIIFMMGSPIEGYASINRDYIKYAPEKDYVAPEGMFPVPEEAGLTDYLDATWYVVQERYWWASVVNKAMCNRPHPSQTMKEEVARIRNGG